MTASRLAAAAAFTLIVAAPAAGQPAQLVVQLWSFGIAPQPIHLTAGKPVTLTFVNQSGSGHDFTAPGFFQHAKFVAGAAPNSEIELAAHERKTVTLIPAAGTFQAHCSHFGHKQLGMTDQIIVN